jgi:GT2 family glycosyltransferase
MKQGIMPCDNIYEGYYIGTLLTGWCIFVTRSCIEKIGSLDETYSFWCSDNAYADQLKAHGIRHGLFCNVRVDHLTSATLKTLPVRKQRKYAYGNINKYRQANAIR